MRTRLQPANLADPVRYSHGWRAGNTVYLAGALGNGPDGTFSPDIRIQTRRAFEKLATVMQEAGGRLTDIVKLTVFIGWTRKWSLGLPAGWVSRIGLRHLTKKDRRERTAAVRTEDPVGHCPPRADARIRH